MIHIIPSEVVVQPHQINASIGRQSVCIRMGGRDCPFSLEKNCPQPVWSNIKLEYKT